MAWKQEQTTVEHLSAVGSDHSPLVIKLVRKMISISNTLSS